ncbi:hydrolase [Micromonospora sp. NPDC049679]|uniref:alpha/beta hydrolase family protein n=1 Tax=Micromonospora sp. NPDC049679 TaxID=3155920 RepID=UPI0033DC7A46
MAGRSGIGRAGAVLLAVATAALVAPTAVTAPAAAQAVMAAEAPEATLALPAPTGRYPVGVTDLHLVDEDRADPWVPERRRELMVSLWYPAANRHGAPDRYASPEESRLILQHLGAEGVPVEALSTVRTHGVTGVRALPRHGGWPLVVLSPGFSFPRTSLTALAEDLASRGYVVAGVDHTYEAAAVTFPDDRLIQCLVCTLLDEERVKPTDVTRGRAADISFVLDEVTGRHLIGAPRPAGPLAAVTRAGIRIDRDRIAMAGHSIGGASAAETMLRDSRVDAGVNMDGTFFPPITTDLKRPFLMLGAEGHGEPGVDQTWDVTWEHLTGSRLWITVTGTTHSSFTDYAVLGDQVGLPLQPLSGERCAEITRQYVAAFVDRHLRHRPSPLLNGPSARYPEVVFRP